MFKKTRSYEKIFEIKTFSDVLELFIMKIRLLKKISGYISGFLTTIWYIKIYLHPTETFVFLHNQ